LDTQHGRGLPAEVGGASDVYTHTHTHTHTHISLVFNRDSAEPKGYVNSGGFRGRPSRLPPLGDRLTPSFTVMLANANFDRFTVKHGTQKFQNHCHQWLSYSFRVHKIRFRPVLCPGSHWGSLHRSPRPLTPLRGPTFKGREAERKGREREGSAPLSQITGSALGERRWPDILPMASESIKTRAEIVEKRCHCANRKSNIGCSGHASLFLIYATITM